MTRPRKLLGRGFLKCDRDTDDCRWKVQRCVKPDLRLFLFSVKTTPSFQLLRFKPLVSSFFPLIAHDTSSHQEILSFLSLKKKSWFHYFSPIWSKHHYLLTGLFLKPNRISPCFCPLSFSIYYQHNKKRVCSKRIIHIMSCCVPSYPILFSSLEEQPKFY